MAALEHAQGNWALQFLRALGSALPATWISPQDVSLQRQMDPDPRGPKACLCSRFGFAPWDAPPSYLFTPALAPAA